MTEKTVGLKAKYLAARTGILFSLEKYYLFAIQAKKSFVSS